MEGQTVNVKLVQYTYNLVIVLRKTFFQYKWTKNGPQAKGGFHKTTVWMEFQHRGGGIHPLSDNVRMHAKNSHIVCKEWSAL